MKDNRTEIEKYNDAQNLQILLGNIVPVWIIVAALLYWLLTSTPV